MSFAELEVAEMAARNTEYLALQRRAEAVEAVVEAREELGKFPAFAGKKAAIMAAEEEYSAAAAAFEAAKAAVKVASMNAAKAWQEAMA